MTERVREVALMGALVLVLGLGVAFDVTGSKARIEPPGESSQTFAERAVFCPPALLAEGSRSQLFYGASGDETLMVGLDPLEDAPVELPAGRGASHDAGTTEPVDVIGYGGRVVATTVQTVSEMVGRSGSEVKGTGAAACASSASTQWYFPAGSTSIDADERILVVNPFPDEAVVRISFITPGGVVSSAKLADVAVPSGKVTRIELNKAVVAQRLLSVTVTAVRGRVVAWKGLVSKSDQGPDAFQFTLGAPELARTWYFPEGEIGPGREERIVVMNPTADEATATLTLTNGDRVLQSPELVDIQIAPQSSESISLPDAVTENQAPPGGVSAFLQTTNGVAIAAERTLAYDGGGVDGLTTEVGATVQATSWMLGPAADAPENDYMTLMSTGGGDATVDVTLFPAKGPALHPVPYRGLSVPGGLRRRIPLGRFTDGAGMLVLVTSDEPLVAERTSYDGAREDVASVMGVPLD